MTCKKNVITCPICGCVENQRYGFSILVKRRDEKGFPIEVEQKQKYKCKKCGHVWREK